MAKLDIEYCLLAIRDDRGQGANQLAGDALALLGAAALTSPGRDPSDIIAEAHSLVIRLMVLRPSMAAISNWSLLWWRELSARPDAAAALIGDFGQRRQVNTAALTESAVQAPRPISCTRNCLSYESVSDGAAFSPSARRLLAISLSSLASTGLSSSRRFRSRASRTSNWHSVIEITLATRAVRLRIPNSPKYSPVVR